MAAVRLRLVQDVHTPPCLAQNEQVQARAGISPGSGSHTSWNAILPQWQAPAMSMSGSIPVASTRSHPARSFQDDFTDQFAAQDLPIVVAGHSDRKSTRLNPSHI